MKARQAIPTCAAADTTYRSSDRLPSTAALRTRAPARQAENPFLEDARYQPNFARAASLMRSGVHGGSKVIATSTDSSDG